MQNPEPSKSRGHQVERADQGEKLAPGLYFVATPLGNARDITLRALDILNGAEVLAAEDTRRLRQLMDIHGVALAGRRILAYHDHNGAAVRPGLLAALAEGKSVAYASDAGSPLVADPGFALARDAIAAGAVVMSIPGPSAVVAALTVAGLPTDRFTFAGFPPSGEAARKSFFETLASSPGTLVIYESPKKIAASLAAAAKTLGEDRPAVLARELTKKFEEVRRGTLADLIKGVANDPPRGEIVLCIGEGAHVVDQQALEAALKTAMKDMRLKDAAREVADAFGVSKREVYQLGLSFPNL
ncbi:MAG: 16S rRNA (cytidine(1402)-2'-O)-methyltransferase [Pseudomonadota bacterium]